MLAFQPPAPTPTPYPSLSEIERVVNRISDTLNASQQQGAVGAIQLIAIVAILAMIWLILRTYVTRNKKDNSGVLAQILSSQQRQIEAAEKERRESQERMERAAAEAESRYIKFGTGWSEALKYWADQIKSQGVVNGQIAETLEALSIREGNQDAKINSIHESIENVRQALNVLGARIDKLIPEHVATLDTATLEMRTVAASVNAALEALKKKRADTQPLPVITKEIIDSVSDGKPQA